MDLLLLGVLAGFPLLLLALGAAYVYHDAPEHGMNPGKWAAIAFFLPFFGFFAYLFERDDRKPDAGKREEMFVDGPFEIHKSRADDAPFVSSDDADDASEDDPWDDDRDDPWSR